MVLTFSAEDYSLRVNVNENEEGELSVYNKEK
jgi:hypothetical protein